MTRIKHASIAAARRFYALRRAGYSALTAMLIIERKWLEGA